MEIEERLRRASGSADDLTSVLYDQDEEVLRALLANPRLSDDHVNVLLSRRDLSEGFLRELLTCERLLQSYTVKLAFVRHPHAPRSAALAMLRHLYTFDLLRVVRTAGAAAQIRKVAEEALIVRLPSLPLGERISLARQAPADVVSAMLADKDEAVYRAALDNPQLTEEGVVRALKTAAITAEAVDAIACHTRWASRHEVHLAVIRSPGASLGRVLALVGGVSRRELAELTGDRRMPRERRHYLAQLAASFGHPGVTVNEAGSGRASGRTI